MAGLQSYEDMMREHALTRMQDGLKKILMLHTPPELSSICGVLRLSVKEKASTSIKLIIEYASKGGKLKYVRGRVCHSCPMCPACFVRHACPVSGAHQPPIAPTRSHLLPAVPRGQGRCWKSCGKARCSSTSKASDTLSPACFWIPRTRS
jgi:hypothetical protein